MPYPKVRHSIASHELGNVKTTGTVDGAGEIASVNTADGTCILVALLEETGTLNGKAAITVALYLDVERLRTKVCILVVNHL